MDHRFVICIRNDDYPAALEKRKIYELAPDEGDARHDQIRVIDDSGEAYLYPADYFIEVSHSKEAEEAIIQAA